MYYIMGEYPYFIYDRDLWYKGRFISAFALRLY